MKAAKINQEINALTTKVIKTFHGGDRAKYLDFLKSALGSKEAALRDYSERRAETYVQPVFPEEDEESV